MEFNNSSEQVRQLADIYGRGARAYANVLDPTLEPMAHQMLEIAALSVSSRAMDLATGTGIIARVAAHRCAHVVAVDLSSGMLSIARRLSTRSIAFVQADASRLPFARRAFDAATCGLSLSHFIDVRMVLAELCRILRPGGIFVASTWGSTGSDPSYAAALSVYKSYRQSRPRPFSHLLDESSWRDPDRGRKLIAESGLKSVDMISRRFAGTYDSPLAAVEWALAWPLTAEGRDQLASTVRDALWASAVAAVERVGDLAWHRDVHYYVARAPSADV